MAAGDIIISEIDKLVTDGNVHVGVMGVDILGDGTKFGIAAFEPNLVSFFTVTPTLTATPDYSAGDCVDTIKTIANVAKISARPVQLKSIQITDKAGQAPALTLMFFKATPSGGTYTDNSTLAFGAGDLANLVYQQEVAAGDWYVASSGNGSVCYTDINLDIPITATSLFMLIEADATWNAGSTSDLIITLGVRRP